MKKSISLKYVLQETALQKKRQKQFVKSSRLVIIGLASKCNNVVILEGLIRDCDCSPRVLWAILNHWLRPCTESVQLQYGVGND